MWHIAFSLEIKLAYSTEFIFKLKILLGDENERGGGNSGVKPTVCHFGEALMGVATDLD